MNEEYLLPEPPFHKSTMQSEFVATKIPSTSAIGDRGPHGSTSIQGLTVTQLTRPYVGSNGDEQLI